jgi:hypothetical protein
MAEISVERKPLRSLGANQLTVGSNNLSTTVSGVISDCGGRIDEHLATSILGERFLPHGDTTRLGRLETLALIPCRSSAH